MARTGAGSSATSSPGRWNPSRPALPHRRAFDDRQDMTNKRAVRSTFRNAPNGSGKRTVWSKRRWQPRPTAPRHPGGREVTGGMNNFSAAPPNSYRDDVEPGSDALFGGAIPRCHCDAGRRDAPARRRGSLPGTPESPWTPTLPHHPQLLRVDPRGAPEDAVIDAGGQTGRIELDDIMAGREGSIEERRHSATERVGQHEGATPDSSRSMEIETRPSEGFGAMLLSPKLPAGPTSLGEPTRQSPASAKPPSTRRGEGASSSQRNRCRKAPSFSDTNSGVSTRLAGCAQFQSTRLDQFLRG